MGCEDTSQVLCTTKIAGCEPTTPTVYTVDCCGPGPGPSNSPPQAEFMYDYHYTQEDIIEGTIDLQTALTTIQFTDYSIDYDGYIINWYWDFGDENIGTEQNPMHQYAEIGDYIITLYVMDNQGMEDSVSHQISLTLPEDETLMIHTWEEVVEGYEFPVYVSDGYNLIPNVTVKFNNKNYTTNETGVVNLTAPYIDQDIEYYVITASKEEYDSNTTIIQIRNNKLHVVTYNETGYYMESVPENTLFIVAIYDYYGQTVENATVTLLNQNKTTDEDGATVLFTPSVDENISYLITATKEGYSPDSIMINVTNIPGYTSPELHVYILDESGYLAENNSVYENTTFTVIVTDETDMYGIQNAAVEFNGQTKYTNETGETTFKAPFVNNDKTFDVISFAEGCQINITSIHILDDLNTGSQPQGIYVYIINNSYSETDSVLENESFYAYVTNELDSPIPGVSVMFSPVTNMTFVPQNQISNEEGLVEFTAPLVDCNEIFNITATRDGLSDSKLLIVIDQPVNTSTTGTSHLNETSLMFILATIISVGIALLLFFWWRRRKSKKKQQVSTFEECNNILPQEEKTNKIKIMRKEVGPSSFEPVDKEKPQIDCSSTDYMNKRINMLIKKRKNIIKN
jgi:hypothetical protein